MMTRRQAIKTTALASAALATLPGAIAQPTPGNPVPILISTAPQPFTLPPLPYAYDALEPHIDARTMEIHHDKHHAAYVANLNKAVADYPDLGKKSIEDLMKDLNEVPEKIRTAVRNQGGGHYNHSLFWQMMKKGGGGEPTGDLAKAIDASFGSFGEFKGSLSKAALGQFGSGWAWLVIDGKTLKIEPSANQDTPLSSGKTPLLGLDVWEHAYYLKYQNKRADYITAWWNVVNWDFVSERYAKAKA
ncbi:MAG TPA: superoxide dismutase [Verrucomicrobiae bacterium]|nr:superoxide dismutase [Verrucomicrobiae bacterium]